MKKYSIYILSFISIIFCMSGSALALPGEGVEEEVDIGRDELMHPLRNVENEGTLYRIDSRPYEEIFQHGFQAHGYNDNLQDHLTSRSCTYPASGNIAQPNTAFISVSASSDWSERYVLGLMNPDRLTVNRYRIRSSNNIYQMTRTLNAYDPTYNSGLDTAGAQSEWIAYRYIPREDIIGVDVYTQRGSRIYRSFHSNSHYVDRVPVVTMIPYAPTSTASPPNNHTTFLSSLVPLVTACFDPALYSCSGSQGSRALDEKECKKEQSKIRVLSNELRFNNTLYGINNTILSIIN